jgi:hypothetical protein
MGTRHGKPKTKNTIAVPRRFSLLKYKALNEFNAPLPWLKQLAFRIDLMSLWNAVATYPNFSSSDDRMYVDERYATELLDAIQDEGIVPVEQLVNAYRGQGVNFKAFDLVINGLDPVRPMTWIDPLLASSVDNPFKQARTERFFESVRNVVPFPQEELILAGLNDDEDQIACWSPPCERSREQEVLEGYRRRLLDFIDIRRERDKGFLEDNKSSREESFDDFMDQPLSDGPSRSNTAFFVVDVTAPFKDAARAFEKHFKRIRQNGNGITISSALFDAWNANKILPYIDLSIFASIEGMRHDNSSLRIPTLLIAKALFGNSATPDDARRMKKNSDPLVSALMDPISTLFRALLHEIHSDKPIQLSQE